MQERTLSRPGSCDDKLKSLFREKSSCQVCWRKIEMAWVSPTLSKPDIGKGLFEAVQFIGTKASGYPSWPGVTDSTKGRIHWRRPSAILCLSLATPRRTLHFDKKLTGWDSD